MDENKDKQSDKEFFNLNSISNDEQKNSSKNINDKNNEEKIKILEDFNSAKNNGIKGINKQINNANKKLDTAVDKYNETLANANKISSLYGEKILETILNECKKNKKQWELGDDQLLFIAKQCVSQDYLQGNKKQLEYLSEAAKSLKEKEKKGNKNPLVSSGYLDRVAKFINIWLEQEQKRLKKEKGSDEKKLKKKSSSLQKWQYSLLKKKQKKNEKFSNLMQNNLLKRQNYNKSINNIYNQKFEEINKRYKKILGLEEKYHDKINTDPDIDSKKELVKNFKNDVSRMLKASFSELKEEEDNKFNEKGERIETKLEKKNNKNKKLDSSSKIKNQDSNSNQIDYNIKKAFKDYNNTNEKKLNIENLNEADNNFKSNIGLNKKENIGISI